MLPRPQAVGEPDEAEARARPRSRPPQLAVGRVGLLECGPAPKAPEAATVTCHASPASSSRPSQSTRQVSGFAVSPARMAPACVGQRAQQPLPGARRAARRGRAGPRSPRSRTAAPGSASPVRARAGGCRARPACTPRRAHRASPIRRAKSFAVPAGITATGSRRLRLPRQRARCCRRRRPRPRAGRPTPPPRRARRCRSASPRRRTRSRHSAHSSGSLEPDRALATSATLVAVRADPACVFLDAPAPAMLLALMGAQARVFVTRKLPGQRAGAPRGRARRGGVARAPATPARRAARPRARARGAAVAAHRPGGRRADRCRAQPARDLELRRRGGQRRSWRPPTARGIPVGNTPDVLTDSTADLASR